MYPKGPIRLMYMLYKHIFPQVKSELNKWKSYAEKIPDPELRKQALDSLRNKRFHCEGGAVYAAAHFSQKDILIPLIVAYQTISDYLDNLCDRSSSVHPENFANLHRSMMDAVSLTQSDHDYYAFNHEKNDGGYLAQLIRTCQQSIRQLPQYDKVQEKIEWLASLYCELQVHKHTRMEEREGRLISWWEKNQYAAPNLRWNEFAAAAGSTLGVFHLFQAASEPSWADSRLALILQAYFPWICSLHILLDYLIDLEEDELGGDLNFISYYDNQQDIYERIHYVAEQAKTQASLLPDSAFHQMIIDGLLGLYLSDGKVSRQPMVQQVAQSIIRSSSLRTRFFFWNSRSYRGSQAIIQAPPNR